MKKLQQELSKILVVAIFLLVGFAFFISKNEELYLKLHSKLFPSEMEIELCKSNLLTEHLNVKEAISKITYSASEIKNYLAYKGVSQYGIEYLLLLNSATDSTVLTYQSLDSAQITMISRNKGQELYNKIKNLERSVNIYGGRQFHDTCDFLRAGSKLSHRNISIVNAKGLDADNISFELLQNIKGLFNEVHNDYSGELIEAVETGFVDENFDAVSGGDIFYELRTLQLQENNK